MPVLKNARHELFAQELAKGTTADKAYVLAGYKQDRPHASRLATDGNIQARVAEIIGRGAERAAVTIESLILEAEQARDLAMRIDQPSAAVSALTAKAKLAGLWIEKSERTNFDKRDPTDWTRDELVTFLDDRRASGNGVAAPNGRGGGPDSLH